MSETELLATLEGRTAYVRVVGRATFACSTSFRRFCEELIAGGIEKLAVDLENCNTMDSTFMGVLTKFGLEQRKSGEPVELLQVGSNNSRLLAELGVDGLFVFVSAPPPEGEWINIYESESTSNEALLEQGKTSLLAHQKLIEADNRNAARFGAVVDSLAEDVRELEGQSKPLEQSRPDDDPDHLY